MPWLPAEQTAGIDATAPHCGRRQRRIKPVMEHGQFFPHPADGFDVAFFGDA